MAQSGQGIYPGSRVTYQIAQPFRPLTRKGDEEVTREINTLGAHLIRGDWVSQARAVVDGTRGV
jgi:hypothetical protein